MAGAIASDLTSDGTKRYRARYRDAGGRQHEKRFKRRVDAQRWLDEQTSALVTQTWTAPERGRITVEAWAEQWLAAQTGLKPSTLYRYRSLLRSQILPRWGSRPATPDPARKPGQGSAPCSSSTSMASRWRRCAP